MPDFTEKEKFQTSLIEGICRLSSRLDLTVTMMNINNAY